MTETRSMHRLYGGPLDGQLFDPSHHEPGVARFTFQTHLPHPDGWGGSIQSTHQADYVAREVFFGDQMFTLWVWSELP